METVLTNFHFLRPLWLTASVPALALFGFTWFVRVQSSRWNRAIDRSLLPHLLDTKQRRRQGWPLFVLLLAWLLTSFCLAGPVWEKLPQPVQKKEDALVIVQDLSLSMYARDLSPDRLTRARHKIEDVLDLRKEGSTALVVYSGDAHIVAPLTDDSRTIKALVPALSPGIMPSYGSNVAEAVETGLQLFKDAGIGQGRMLLLTDEVAPDEVDRISRILKGKGIILYVLGVGTRDGGPIPKSDGGFLKDSEGNIVVPRLNSPVLEDLAGKNNGHYREITLDDADIQSLLKNDLSAWQEKTFSKVDREFDQWEEMGPWLLFLIAPLALLAFRRGWIVVLVCAVLLSGRTTSHAMSWDDLWQRKDQRAARALAEDDPQQAAELFTSSKWKAAARYRAGDYGEAAEAFGQGEGADDLYNRGNALAKTGKLEEAAAAYDQALEVDPEMEDAKANRELVEKLIQQDKDKGKDKEKGKEKGKEKEKGKGKDSGDGEKQDGSQGKEQDQQPGEKNDKQGEGESSEQQEEQSSGQEKKNASDRPDEQAEQNKEKGGQAENQEKSKGSAEGEQEKSAKQPENNKDDRELDGPQGTVSDESLSEEEQQALEQWLRQVPDNPGGLLRRKFEYEYQRNQGQRRSAPNVPNKKIW